MKSNFELTAVVPKSVVGNRLDQVLKILFHQYSRTFLKKMVLRKNVFVNGNVIDQPDSKISFNDVISINIQLEDNNFYQSENISLNIIYEDKDILVINKQDNFVVHPGAGCKNGTLLNALLHKDNIFYHVPRAGIVHRLDKDTTGLMIIAKNILAYKELINQIKCKTVIREYQAIVYGRVISGGTVTQPIMRNPTKRISMIVDKNGKKAVTHYRIIRRFSSHTHLKINLETGRTHQIRTHMLHINFPLVGDKLYRNQFKFYKNIKFDSVKVVKTFPRQALHASRLSLYHPLTKILMEWNSELPRDMLCLIKSLTIIDK